MKTGAIRILNALCSIGRTYIHDIGHETRFADPTVKRGLEQLMEYKLVKKSPGFGPRNRRTTVYEATDIGKELAAEIRDCSQRIEDWLYMKGIREK